MTGADETLYNKGSDFNPPIGGETTFDGAFVAEVPPETPPVPEFDPRWKEDLEGLLIYW